MPDTVVTTATAAVGLPFSDVHITQAINKLPTPFGQFTAEGYFPVEPLSGQHIEIDIVNGVLSVLPVTGDGPATVAKHDDTNALIFKVPTIKHQDDVMAKDIKGMLQIAARSKNPETLADLFNKRLQRLKNKFNMTQEFMMVGSVKGVILDGAGKELYNLFTAFGITKKIVYFDLSDDSTNVQEKCDLLYQLVTQDLSDEVMTIVKVKCSRGFFNKLIAHPKVEKFYMGYLAAQNLANMARGSDGGYRPRSFEFGNIIFEEYSAVVPMWGGTNASIIAANKAHAYPAGTLDSHATYVSPPDDIRELDGGVADVNDIIHVTTELMKHGAGIELLGQAHMLPLWRKPDLLVECDAGDGSSTTPTGD